MAQADMIEVLTATLWRLWLASGAAGVLHMDWQDPGVRVRRLAKACGVTPGQVESWLAGQSAPLTGQAIAFLGAFPFVAADVAELNGAVSHG